MTTVQFITLIVVLINIITFCMFWWDKTAARAGHWRVPESRLLGFALLGGSIGAIAGQQLLRHKTRKEPFRTELMLIMAVHIGSLTAWLSAPLWIQYAFAIAR